MVGDWCPGGISDLLLPGLWSCCPVFRGWRSINFRVLKVRVFVVSNKEKAALRLGGEYDVRINSSYSAIL